MDTHKKYAVIAVLVEVYEATQDPDLKARVGLAALSLRSVPADPADPEYASAYQQGKVLAERYQDLCLNTSSKQSTGVMLC